ncbi:CRISPR-associated endoribonuclease Cas6 [Sulfurospirillum multivorans]|uniref:CRISPR-associated endoribonuclease Cas6 n=2 Tax=Sulfurospirillum multivorans TaxID=66821 RepID=A0AA86AKS9_SULMK|nr:CRISPR-associated endoribonuclease Cas6 [Sulfurospirillum multivorans]AHJ12406.1 CRISPR-associated endoribonuclease Cas6 [Sulfurospirillum multivorans DSM 12446]QEH05904.1 CRISPR-associated endoribonuclease Cas6 [Sulfurospirillum multivorans]
MNYFELTCKVFIKKNIAFQASFELLSKYISFSMYQEGIGEVHQKEGFKYYVFGGLLPIEKEKVYKQGNLYSFTIRSLDETLIDTLKTTLRQNINNENLLVVEAHKKTISQFFITELYSATPVIVSVGNGKYWTMQESGDIIQLQKQLHENAEKKYQSFFGESLHVKENCIQMIKILNEKPQNIVIHKDGKAIRFFGNKVSLIINEDEVSQKLAFVALACGLSEKNSYGAGFMLGRGMK